ncbi:UNVERIFIED_CONTAM: hypothetical protein BEN50_22270, partial [Euhalothece sp. KZN 001]
MSSGVDAISAERWRQVFEEGWTYEHDDQHVRGELGAAAACYAAPSRARDVAIWALWPATWDKSHFKPAGACDDLASRRRDLEKAGALIAAEIERIDRCLDRRR